MDMPIFWFLGVFLSLGLLATIVLNLVLSRQLRSRSEELEEIKVQVFGWSQRLEQKVADRTKALEDSAERLQETSIETVTSLVKALAAKDPYLYAHAHNVAVYAKVVAEELGFADAQIRRLMQGCELHDVGKIAIPDSILLKKGPLTNEEYHIIKEHPNWGAQILEPLSFMKDIVEMVHQEHERWDGTGYPLGLKGEEIRLEARVIAVADALDAMTSHRPYRRQTTLEEAWLEIKRCSGTQFDPKVVSAFDRAVQKGRIHIITHEKHPELAH